VPAAVAVGACTSGRGPVVDRPPPPSGKRQKAARMQQHDLPRPHGLDPMGRPRGGFPWLVVRARPLPAEHPVLCRS